MMIELNCVTLIMAILSLTQTNDFHKNMSKDVEERFNISSYRVTGPIAIDKNKKVIGTMEGWIGWRDIEGICSTLSKDVFLQKRKR